VECGRHALTVDMAGGYIAYFGGGDPSTPLNFPSPEELKQAAKDARDRRARYVAEQAARFARVAERYRDGFAAKDPAAIALLERVCLFRLGVTADLLAKVFTGWRKSNISGPALARLNRKALQAKLDLLTDMRLLERSKDGKYSVHPAVRDGFLKGLDPDAAGKGHAAVREGLEAQLGDRPGEENPSDPAILDLLEEIVYHTIEAGAPEEAWNIYWSRIGGYKNLGWRLGDYERGERICRAFAGGRPPESAPLPDGLTENDQSVFINEWAIYMMNLGRLDAAARCLGRNIEIRVQQERWDSVSVGSQNLADMHLLAGRRRDWPRRRAL